MTVTRLIRFALHVVMVMAISATQAYAFWYGFAQAALHIDDERAVVTVNGESHDLNKQLKQAFEDAVHGSRLAGQTKRVTLVSAVGPYASFRVSAAIGPEDLGRSAVARQQGYVMMYVVDIRRPSKPTSPVSLRDIFSEARIRASLADSCNADLREAFQAFDQRYALEGFEAPLLPPDGGFLYEFAIGRVTDKFVDIHLQMQSPGFGDGLDHDTFYTLRLPTPASLTNMLPPHRDGYTSPLTSADLKPSTRPTFILK